MAADQTSSPQDLRRLLFSIVYRMTASAAESEDIVQESLIRLELAARQGVEIESPRAYAVTIATRQAIDHLRSARVQRERYPGPWLPEPVLTEGDAGGAFDPAASAELADSLSMSYLVLLDALSPVERAVFLLREVFDHRYSEIAEIVQRSEPNCRQIFHRARARLERAGPPPPLDAAGAGEQERLAGDFIRAFQDGDVERVLAVVAADAIFYGDGGGKARGLPRPIYGRARIGRLLAGFHSVYASSGARIVPATINGRPGTLNLDGDGRLVGVFAFEIAGGAIQAIRSVVNPDKLRHLGYELSGLNLIEPG